MNWTLPARPPFSLSAVIRSHGWAQLAPFATDESRSTLTYVAPLAPGSAAPLHIREAPAGVRIDVDADLTATERGELSAHVTWMLDLDRDLTPFYAAARDEPKLAHVETGAHGRLLRSPTLFEDTVKTILTTNTTWAGTIRMVQALVSLYGSPMPTTPERRTFPTPDRLADAGLDDLRTAAKLGYRAPYVLGLARAVATGDLDLEGFKATGLPTPELRKRLLGIKGVGAYAAANLLMLLGRYDYLPVDSWALKLVSHEWHGGEPVGPAEVEAAFEDWGPWRGLAFWFWDWSYTG